MPGRLDELVRHVRAHTDSSAQIYRADDPDPRVVVIDPTGSGPAEVPGELLARTPHAWIFSAVSR